MNSGPISGSITSTLTARLRDSDPRRVMEITAQ